MPDQVIGNEQRQTPWADPSTGSPDKRYPSNVVTAAKEVPHHNGQSRGAEQIEPTFRAGTVNKSSAQRYQPNDGSRNATNS